MRDKEDKRKPLLPSNGSSNGSKSLFVKPKKKKPVGLAGTLLRLLAAAILAVVITNAALFARVHKQSGDASSALSSFQAAFATKNISFDAAYENMPALWEAAQSAVGNALKEASAVLAGEEEEEEEKESDEGQEFRDHNNNNNNNHEKESYDVCIVGAGLSGAVLAERYVAQLQATVLLLERRPHMGGNCYDYIDDETGIRVSQYGAHLFHTVHNRVANFVQSLGRWLPYEHKVRAIVQGKNVPIPVNIETVNTLFGLDLKDSKDMSAWLQKEQIPPPNPEAPENSEQVALSRVGRKLYDLIFKPYTYKQWAKYPAELGPEVLARIPVRNSTDARYFGDPFQALPAAGYTSIFQRMLSSPLVTLKTDTDFFQVRDQYDCKRLYYSGPIDTYFADKGWDKLEYRSLDFERVVQKDVGQDKTFQSDFVVNHPQNNVDYTRIVEYKHLPIQPWKVDDKTRRKPWFDASQVPAASDHTVYFIERSKDGGEPYYPVPNPANKALYAKYRALADQEPGVTFVGRLANYKYFNMDQAIDNALTLFSQDTGLPEYEAPDKVGPTPVRRLAGAQVVNTAKNQGLVSYPGKFRWPHYHNRPPVEAHVAGTRSDPHTAVREVHAQLAQHLQRALNLPVDKPVGLRHEAFPPGKDAVMGLAAYPRNMATFRLLVGSLRRTGYDGHIIFGVHAEIPPEEEEYLKAMDVTYYIVDFVDCDPSIMDAGAGGGNIRGKCSKGLERLKLEWGRFEMCRQWLHACKTCTGWNLVMDTRDVFFQANPFASLPPAATAQQDLLFMEEIAPHSNPRPNDPHRADILGDSRYVARTEGCYGDNHFTAFYNRPILCSGTIIGNQQGMHRFLSVLVDEFLRHNAGKKIQCRSPTATDQWTMNYLYYTGRFGLFNQTISLPYGTGPVNTIGTACVNRKLPSSSRTGQSDLIILDESAKAEGKDYVLNIHESIDSPARIAAVVHQHDRCHAWMVLWLRQHPEFSQKDPKTNTYIPVRDLQLPYKQQHQRAAAEVFAAGQADELKQVLTHNAALPDASSMLSKIAKREYDICVVGAGLSGAVMAERYASQLDKSVLVMEKRNHIGGNCYDFLDTEVNVRVSKYGAHLFHTKYERVWNYVQQFSEWTPYEHKVIGYVNKEHVPIPVNIETVNKLFGLSIQTESEMDAWLESEQVKYDHEPANAEEVALSRVGRRLYELIFHPYTMKQWDREPAELGPEVTARIPVRNSFDGRYFSDPWQALPKKGYTAIFEKMFDHQNIEVHTEVDYFVVRDGIKCGRTYYTGPIDTYFADLGLDKLEYRSLDFERKVAMNTNYFQPAFVVNHPYAVADFTRIVEYKHLPDQPPSDHTVYFIERSKDTGEPYYPVPNKRNKDLFAKYKEMAMKEQDVTFVGRLANYKYFNMDQAILNALELFDQDTGVARSLEEEAEAVVEPVTDVEGDLLDNNHAAEQPNKEVVVSSAGTYVFDGSPLQGGVPVPKGLTSFAGILTDPKRYDNAPPIEAIAQSKGQAVDQYKASLEKDLQQAMSLPLTEPVGLRHEAFPPGKDAVMGLAAYPRNMGTFRLLVGSLRRTGYDGHIILGVHAEIPPNEEEYLKAMDVTYYIVDFVDCDPSIMDAGTGGGNIRGKCSKGLERLKLEWGRFEACRQWLNACKTCTGWTLVMDTRDIFFQAHPFASLPPAETAKENLLFIEEIAPHSSPIPSDPIRSDVIGKSRYVGRTDPCYGRNHYQAYHHRPVLCSGTIIGNREGTHRFLSVLVDEFYRHNAGKNMKCRSPHATDQWTMNYLYYYGRFGEFDRTKTLPYGTGPINTIGTVCINRHLEGKDKHSQNDMVLLEDEHPRPGQNVSKGMGYILNIHETEDSPARIAPAVHQYDRCANWVDRWLRRHPDFSQRKIVNRKLINIPTQELSLEWKK